MPHVKPIPEGMHSVTPHLVCAGAADAIEFYKKAFGAEELRRMPGPDGRLMHAAMKIDGRVMFLADDFPEYCGGKEHNPNALGGTPVTIHRYVRDCDAVIDRAVKAGATPIMPASDMFWGDRYGLIRDPFGHNWAVATRIKDMTDAEMMEASKECFANAPA